MSEINNPTAMKKAFNLNITITDKNGVGRVTYLYFTLYTNALTAMLDSMKKLRTNKYPKFDGFYVRTEEFDDCIVATEALLEDDTTVLYTMYEVEVPQETETECEKETAEMAGYERVMVMGESLPTGMFA